MHCNKVSFQELLDCFDNDLGNNLENNADNLEHNAEKLQEILNRIMQRIMSIITSALQMTCIMSSVGGVQYCPRCRVIKPDHCHHCSLCNRCVLKIDHHCPWYPLCLSLCPLHRTCPLQDQQLRRIFKLQVLLSILVLHNGIIPLH